MHVVVVESPAKARTIEKYLGSDFTVVASYGHVSDLAPRDGSVLPDKDFEMVYAVGERARKPLSAIAAALRGADDLLLATDPDREGEAISWHVRNWLRDKGALGRRKARRVIFHEITRDAVRHAMAHPRDIDMALVNAQQARRALDYLVGFNLSPVLWRKLPGSRSAGRVQSVALRLVCAREAEIEAFVPREYWSVEADLARPGGAGFSARLVALDGVKLDKFALADSDSAQAAAQRVRAGSFAVTAVERKQVKRNPAPPFITSTLQQEASRKLGFAAARTMQVAQRLYEGVDLGGETVGLITYMRTDSVALSRAALESARRLIAERYGQPYLPARARVFRSSTRNAQEAHEAIRPTAFERAPASVAARLGRDEAALYELIWKRALASQMAPAALDKVAVDIATPAGDVALRATGSTLAFDGFMRLYLEGRDDASRDDDRERRLPPLRAGEALDLGEVRPQRHVTEPAPRYSEASLVKRLEELGIGRPSTYASILAVLQEREYVLLEKKRFHPSERGRLVTAFLEAFFPAYVEYGFTAGLENELDRIAKGAIDWKQVLRDFWEAFHMAVQAADGLERERVTAALEQALAERLFPRAGAGDDDGDGDDRRLCPACKQGRLELKLGRYGAFLGCSGYPECRHRRRLGESGDGEDGPRQLGADPESGLAITLRRGPYGPYVQKGEGEAKGAGKPQRVSLPKDKAPGEIDLAAALALLALPRELGAHPDDGAPIQAGIGRYGPYLKHGRAYTALPAGDDVLTVGLNRAVTLIAEKGKRAPRQAVVKALGAHPDDGAPVEIRKGRYGPYAAHGRVFASLPKGVEPEEATLAMALDLLARKKAAGRGAARGRKGAKTPRRAGG